MAEYDIVIIGSGPAGSVAAKPLVDKGLKVIILEQKKLPRYKMCTGMLFPGAQVFIAERYGKIPDEIFSHPAQWEGYKLFPSAETPLEQCMKVFFPIEPLMEPGLPQGLVNTWRDRFDHWLAKQSGAELRDECDFKELLFEGNVIKVKAVLQGKPFEVTAQYVIGADGGTSKVRRTVFPEVDKKITWFPCYEQWYHGTVDLDPNWFYGFLDPKFTGFYSCFYIKDDIFIQVTCGRKGDSIKQLHKNLFEHLKEVHNLKVTEIVAEHGIQINDMAPRDIFCLGKENVLLTGEAAGFLYPFGEGITPAIITGETAAQAIIKSIENNGKAVEQYSKMVEKEIERTRTAHEFAVKAGMDIFRVNPV
jgi:flavin-dependent dehydrogenase